MCLRSAVAVVEVVIISKDTFNPRKITGLDIAVQRGKFLKTELPPKRLYYKQGNAEALPFEDGYFDVVINVESLSRLWFSSEISSEVKRVLCEGGYFYVPICAVPMA